MVKAKNVYNSIRQRMAWGGRFASNVFYIMWHGRQLTLAVACDVNLSKLHRTVRLNHPVGIVIGAPEQIGHGCIIRQNVTIGSLDAVHPSYATLEENVEVGAGATILGPIRIGHDAKIGAGAIILKDVPPNTTAVGLWK